MQKITDFINYVPTVYQTYQQRFRLRPKSVYVFKTNTRFFNFNRLLVIHKNYISQMLAAYSLIVLSEEKYAELVTFFSCFTANAFPSL